MARYRFRSRTPATTIGKIIAGVAVLAGFTLGPYLSINAGPRVTEALMTQSIQLPELIWPLLLVFVVYTIATAGAFSAYNHPSVAIPLCIVFITEHFILSCLFVNASIPAFGLITIVVILATFFGMLVKVVTGT